MPDGTERQVPVKIFFKLKFIFLILRGFTLYLFDNVDSTDNEFDAGVATVWPVVQNEGDVNVVLLLHVDALAPGAHGVCVDLCQCVLSIFPREPRASDDDGNVTRQTRAQVTWNGDNLFYWSYVWKWWELKTSCLEKINRCAVLTKSIYFLKKTFKRELCLIYLKIKGWLHNHFFLIVGFKLTPCKKYICITYFKSAPSITNAKTFVCSCIKITTFFIKILMNFKC